jgi:hypothetical protein
LLSLLPPVINLAIFIGSNFSLIPVALALNFDDIAPEREEPMPLPDVILSVIIDERDLPLMSLATL